MRDFILSGFPSRSNVAKKFGKQKSLPKKNWQQLKLYTAVAHTDILLLHFKDPVVGVIKIKSL